MPFYLFHGSLRSNLDASGSRSNEQLASALEAVGLTEAVEAAGGLEAELKPQVRSFIIVVAT
jgi:ABC-type transport system involved in cytochrome bd biosynthesis fused ATPase/permease subunit